MSLSKRIKLLIALSQSINQQHINIMARRKCKQSNEGSPITNQQEHNIAKPQQEQETITNKQFPIKEILKQAFENKIQSIVSQIVSELWSYREKPKMQMTWDNKDKKKIKRKQSTDLYTVEFPEENEDMLDFDPSQNNDEVHEKELRRRAHPCPHLSHEYAKLELPRVGGSCDS
ncbi:hypothetical protein PIB30_072745 [Stylosanthes scabra]|uniref:Uncharacterized protein n=1 Tax=Stylosanthes scabra TaxID=79078 RepID=A0ABU6ZMU1_9FABA|nr:hypothetical protein [Stylosanthes scabra]